MKNAHPLVDASDKDRIASPAGPIVGVACGRGWLVVEKPCGLSIHNDPGRDLCSLILAALQYGWLPAVGESRHAVHAVHRLDRETSGIVLLGVNPETLAWFGDQFAARTARKRYLAVVHGPIDDPFAGGRWHSWRWPLTATPGGRRDPMGKGRRLACTTRWRLLDHSPHYALIQCEPLTGRKHQIRRHAKLAGHPVVGDRRYGSTRSREILVRQYQFDRLGLHAHTLGVQLPGESMATEFRSVGLPKAMRQLLAADR